MRAAVTRSIVDDVLSWLAPERKAGTQMGDGEKEAAPLVHHNRDYDGLMPLRIIRVPQPVINKEDALRIALTTSALAKELSSLSAFPPVVAAASILLLIFQTIQTIENNKEACANLAHRCAKVLIDLNDIMRDKWDTAPHSLLRNVKKYTETLEAIHTFMKAHANEKWTKRLFRKANIEAALVDFEKKLGDAAHMFQMAMLIDIGHHVLSQKANASHRQPNEDNILAKQGSHLEQPVAYNNLKSRQITLGNLDQSVASPQYDGVDTEDDISNITPMIEYSQEADEDLISEAILEDRGFRRYHHSQVKLAGRSKGSGWWTDTIFAEVDGQSTLVKCYEGKTKNDAIKRWLHDVKKLQNLFHPNLPHMTGYSDEHSPTPFILLSDVRTNAPDKIMKHTLRNEGVAACINLLARYYNDVADVTTYIQRQLNISDNHLQDFVEKASFRIDTSNRIIMGLPPAEERTWVSARNYNLSYSLVKALLNMLPANGMVQSRLEHYQDTAFDQDPLKVAHLVSLARCLLSNKTSAPPLVTKLLEKGDDFDDFSDGRKISMKELRQYSLEAGVHDFFWTEMSAIPAHKFAVGDFGYVPRTTAFSNFVKLGNIYSDNLANLPIVARANGSQFCWEDRPVQHVEIQKFYLPGDIYCWPIPVPRGAQIDCQIEHSERIGDINEAWRFLSNQANQLSRKSDISPEDLILITAAGTNQNYYIRDFGNHVANNPAHRMPHMHTHHPPMFTNMGHTTMSIPTIMYLLTSPSSGFQSFWSHQPMYVPNTPLPKLNYGWVPHTGFCHGFVQWIRLLKEDFID